MSTTFRRNTEDFVCENCGAHVVGDGYTNHCPHCLWSKHVDVYPGDRAARCGGLMKPIEILTQGTTHTILHRCTQCGYIKKNKLSRNDNFERAIAISQEQAQSPE